MLALPGCGGAQPAAAPPGLPRAAPQLFLPGDGELWVVDTATERAREFALPQLSPGDPPHRIAARGGRLVLWGYDTLVVDGRAVDRPPRMLADGSWFFVPGAHPDRVWIAF